MDRDLDAVSLGEGGDEVVIIDQTLLPGECRLTSLKDKEAMRHAIYTLQVRGAPAIGIAAAMGMAVLAKGYETENKEAFLARFLADKAYLASARPTAVNLFWALNEMERCLREKLRLPVNEIKGALADRARALKEAEAAACRAIGEFGLTLLKPGDGILTHCNAGSLATARYGTATAPIYLGHERGYDFHVFADETRPLLQGARLTAYELSQRGVKVTLLCDNMAARAMQQGLIQAVLVGCDRVAANGDIANKIGTLGVAVLAKHYGIPFYVCAPTSTIDMGTKRGADIEIENRPTSEVTDLWFQKRMAPEGISVFNPAFDVTDHSLITAILTERGILRPPYEKSLGEVPSPAEKTGGSREEKNL